MINNISEGKQLIKKKVRILPGANKIMSKLGYYQDEMENKENQEGTVNYFFEKKEGDLTDHVSVVFSDGSEWGYTLECIEEV